MSDFDGPDSYVVIPRHAEDKVLELEEGSSEDSLGLRINEQVLTENKKFLFASVFGDQYLIISATSGTYLTASDNGEQITAELVSPFRDEARWRLEPAEDDSGAYFITSVAFPHKVIDIFQKTTDDLTPAITFSRKDDDNDNQQFFLRSC